MTNPDNGTRSGGRRDVEVPLELYKRITVFSTLIAVVLVVLGFTVLDAATLQAGFLRQFVVAALTVAGVSVPDALLSGVLAVVGLVVIAAGAGVYVLGTRFRTREMGKPQEGANEE